MENPIKMDDLGVPLFLETPNLIYCQFWEDCIAGQPASRIGASNLGTALTPPKPCRPKRRLRKNKCGESFYDHGIVVFSEKKATTILNHVIL